METYRIVKAKTREKYDELEHSWQTGEGKYVQIIESTPGSKNIFYAEPLPQPNHPSEGDIIKILTESIYIVSYHEIPDSVGLKRGGYKKAAKAISTLFSSSDNEGAQERYDKAMKYIDNLHEEGEELDLFYKRVYAFKKEILCIATGLDQTQSKQQEEERC